MRIGAGFIGLPMAGGSAWVPTNITDLNLWVRSDMGTTVHDPAFPVPTDFTNAAWTKINLTPTLVSGTVYELDEGTASSVSNEMYDAWDAYYAGAYAEVSFRVKFVDCPWVSIWVNNAGGAAYYNVQTGTLGSTSGTVISHAIEALADGWYRCSVRYIASGGNALTRFRMAFSDGVTVYTGTNRTVLVDTADVDFYDRFPVSAWADQSGNGRNLAQATATRQPYLALDQINGHSAIVFDGSDDYLRVNYTESQPLTTFLVCIPAATPFVGAQPQDGGGGTGNNCRFYVADATGQDYGMFSGATLQTSGNLDDSTVWQSVRNIFNSTSSSFAVNGTVRASGDAGAVGSSGLTIGAFGNLVSNFTDCSVAEVIRYGRVLTAPEIAQVEAYITARYSL